MRRGQDNVSFNLRSSVETKKKKKKMERRTSTWMLLLGLLLVVFGVAFGQFPIVPPAECCSSSVSPMFILGDSSVDCGQNTLLYPFLRHNLSLYPCNGSPNRLIPHILAEKMGLPEIPPFYGQNGTIEGLLSGLNFGSSPATIMKWGNVGYQSLNEQLRQAFETFQLLQLQLGEEMARKMIKSSLFYLSFGKDDYIEFLLPHFSGVRRKYSHRRFAQILVNQMTQVVKDLYNANVRKIVYTGIGPLGCTPRTLWARYNFTARTEDSGCAEEINKLVKDYNKMLSRRLMNINLKLPDAQIVFCDVYKGMMEIISDPGQYGFENVNNSCCGLGMYGGMVGGIVKEMACEEASNHVWRDLYNPTQAVNSLLADSTWSGQPFGHICRPITIRKLASMSA